MAVRKRVVKKVIQVGDEGTDIWTAVKAELEAHGIDVDECCDLEAREDARVKVVCVSPDLKNSVEELGRSPRDQVVMVRVDEDTSHKLDAWVEAGAVRSRSEAAALFIREGLRVRGSELERLHDALSEVEAAKTRLRDKAREVFGEPASTPPAEKE
jgi:hypothetical protein